MVKCEICYKNFLSITHKHLFFKHGITKEQYLRQFPDAKLFSNELSKTLSIIQKGKKTGDSNPSKRKEVKQKIAETVKQRWQEGNYDKRINGMTGKNGQSHHGWKPEIRTPLYFAENNYVDFLSQFQDIKTCSRCKSIKNKINIHHIDEDHSNFLPSNLEPLCIPCHSFFHYNRYKRAFVSITKIMSFASAHLLPNYEGKCNNLHGHEWKIEVTIKKRINNKTGMVMDFKDLKNIIQQYLIDVLDHNYLNNILENPTAENILFWCWEQLMFKSLLKGIDKIKLWESPDSYSILDKKGMLSVFSENIEKYVNKGTTK